MKHNTITFKKSRIFSRIKRDKFSHVKDQPKISRICKDHMRVLMKCLTLLHRESSIIQGSTCILQQVFLWDWDESHIEECPMTIYCIQ